MEGNGSLLILNAKFEMKWKRVEVPALQEQSWNWLYPANDQYDNRQ